MTPMVKRFQFKRWSPLRRAIHDMARGQTLYIMDNEILGARTHINRLNDAYSGTRRWQLKRENNLATGERDLVLVKRLT